MKKTLTWFLAILLTFSALPPASVLSADPVSSMQLAFDSPDHSIIDFAAFNGALYASGATGHPGLNPVGGRLYRLDTAGWQAVPTTVKPGENYGLIKAYQGALFAGAQGAFGAGITRIYRSTDGVNFTQVLNDPYASDAAIVAMVEYNGALYAFSYSHFGGGRIYKSTDAGLTWTTIKTGFYRGLLRPNSAVVYNGKMYIGSYGGDIPPQGRIAYSTDGVNWTEVGPTGYNWRTLGIHNNKLYASTYGPYTAVGELYESADGANWARIWQSAAPWSSITDMLSAGGNLYLSAQENGAAIYKYDGASMSLFYYQNQETIQSLALSDGKLYAGTSASAGIDTDGLGRILVSAQPLPDSTGTHPCPGPGGPIVNNWDFASDLSGWTVLNPGDSNAAPGAVGWDSAYAGSARVAISGSPSSATLIQRTIRPITAGERIRIRVAHTYVDNFSHWSLYVGGYSGPGEKAHSRTGGGGSSAAGVDDVIWTADANYPAGTEIRLHQAVWPGSATYWWDRIEALTPPCDSTAPATALNIEPPEPDGAAGWYTTLPALSLTADETATTYYQWDATAAAGWQTYSGALAGQEGEHTLYYYSFDSAGNTETVKSSGLIKADIGAPAAPALAGVALSPTEIALTWTGAVDAVSGIAGYQLVDAGTGLPLAQTTQATYTFSNLQPGSTYNYAVKALDAAGNVSPGSDPVSITTPMPTTLTYLGVLSADYSDAALLETALTDINGVPVAGQEVRFTVGSQEATAVTDLLGRALAVININQPSGQKELSVEFYGDGFYLPTAAGAAFTVNKEAAAVTYEGDAITQRYQTAVVKTRLSELDDQVGDLSGKQVDFTLSDGQSTQTASALTDANGLATVAVPITNPAGIYNISARFAGDDYYQSAQSTDTPYLIWEPVAGLKVTGGGWLLVDADGGEKEHEKEKKKAKFAFKAEYEEGQILPEGELEFKNKATGVKIKSEGSFDWFVVTAGNVALVQGSASINGQSGHTFRIIAVDMGSPGKGRDTFELQIDGLTYVSGILDGGNIVIHQDDD